MASGSFALTEELFARGDAAFVSELRRVHDAERLGKFAARWLADPRPAARAFLLEYLRLPLNAYRHEALVKRLFKEIEKKADDELMGAFMVALDRSIRRQRRTRTRHKWERLTTREEAQAKLREWEQAGFEPGSIQNFSNAFFVTEVKTEEVVIVPKNSMPRPPKQRWGKVEQIHDSYRQRLEKRFILFSAPTRRYLRRRAWRYFRKLGKTSPERYRAAAIAYLKRYTDDDVNSDIHLLDNWGLVHTLFFDSPALVRLARGWEFAEGKTVADLAPAPRFAGAWLAAPAALFELLLQAECRTVRQWAAWLLRRHQREWLNQLSLAQLLPLIDHADPDVAALGFDLLEAVPDLASAPVEFWRERLGGDNLEKLQRLSALLGDRLDPRRLPLGECVKLTLHRALPVAQLGLTLLRKGAPHANAGLPEILALVQAECEGLRPEIVGWLRAALEAKGPVRSEWLLEFLDSKFADVRAAGWQWLQESPVKDEVAIWHKLLESPYDDIKGPLAADLARRAQSADPNTVRLLWASVLSNLYGQGRRKPGVVSQVVARLADRADEANALLPLLAIALRSLRGPEFRAGLVGVVSLLETRPVSGIGGLSDRRIVTGRTV
jgi:hypothetical protein